MYKVAILTISDSCHNGKRIDQSGPAIQNFLEQRGSFSVTNYEIFPDEREQISEKLRLLSENIDIDLILTTGGTGFGPRDNTPEATMAVIEREVQGISEFMRAKTSQNTMNAWLSRARAGLRGKCLIINLPGSVKGASESLEAIYELLPHAFAMIRGEGH